MQSTITFTHGLTTCASEPGKFCGFFGTRNCGATPVCTLFSATLFDDEKGRVERCQECATRFGGGGFQVAFPFKTLSQATLG